MKYVILILLVVGCGNQIPQSVPTSASNKETPVIVVPSDSITPSVKVESVMTCEYSSSEEPFSFSSLTYKITTYSDGSKEVACGDNGSLSDAQKTSGQITKSQRIGYSTYHVTDYCQFDGGVYGTITIGEWVANNMLQEIVAFSQNKSGLLTPQNCVTE